MDDLGRIIPIKTVAQLAERASAGEISAQTALYDRLAPKFLGFLARLCGNLQDAEDIAQEAFLLTFERLHKIEPNRFQAYLYGVGARKCQHLFRKRGLLRRLGIQGGEVELRGVAKEEATLDERTELKRIFEFLHKQPAKQRLAWSLCRVEGYTIEEAARLIGCSTATVKRYLQAVEERLSKHLKRADNA